MTYLTAEQAWQIEEAFEGIKAIMSDSKGVTGYHLNGEVADWDCFDEVNGIDEALATIRAARAQEQAEHEPVGDVKALDYAILTLHSIACLTQSDNLLWWQERARSALARIDELLGVRPVAIYQEPASRAILCPPAPPEVYKMRSRDAFEAGWWEAQRQKAVSPISPVQQAKQEPVAEVVSEHTHGEYESIKKLVDYRLPCKTKLYAAPVRTKDLTDFEIDCIRFNLESGKTWIDFARAVIAKFKEKNK